MMTQDDVLSPSLQRKLSNNAKSYKNFNLASKVFLILGRWIETHFEVCTVHSYTCSLIMSIEFNRIFKMIQR